MQDFNDMAYFAEVVDRGGFTAAGRSLAMPKSRLSRRVAELESRLGARLLQRTTRKLSMTTVGEQVYRHCVAMREQAQAVEEVVAQSHTAPCGTIRVACPITLAQTTIGPLVFAFLARYPQVTIDMRISNRVVDLVEEGFDVALRVRSTLDDSGSMVVKNLGPTYTLLVASPALLARQGRPTQPQDLTELDTVGMAAINGLTTWSLRGPAGAAFTLSHQPRLIADDLLTLLQAARDGLGMTVVPDYMCHDELQRGELVLVLPGWAPPPAIVHAVFPSRRGLVPAVRQFLDFLGEMLKGSSAAVTPTVAAPR
ncbi:MAG: LysR substrate-binding domain-containing protein [Betaproteobacteria bacterium]